MLKYNQKLFATKFARNAKFSELRLAAKSVVFWILVKVVRFRTLIAHFKDHKKLENILKTQK